MADDRRQTRMLGALLRVPAQAINARIAADLAAAGHGDLRPAHFSVFQYLEPEGSRLTDLAERAQMTKPSMGELVDHLARHDYVERVADAADGRARIVRRTERGWAVERTARESIRRLEEEWGARLGEERLGQFRAFLEDLAALLEE